MTIFVALNLFAYFLYCLCTVGIKVKTIAIATVGRQITIEKAIKKRSKELIPK